MRERKLPKLDIAALQSLLKNEEDTPIEIKPNGEVWLGGKKRPVKIITLKENLGGEYASRRRITAI